MPRGREAKAAHSKVALRDVTVVLGRRLAVGFHRTLRVPDDGRSYPLPPSFGRFPLYASADYADRVPASWLGATSFFVPLHQREALWLGFEGPSWHPSALVIGADGVNVITGKPWVSLLSGSPQNYIVAPDQPWLDGIRTRSGAVRQFVAMPLGEGYTLAEQVRDRSKCLGIQLRVHDAKPRRFPDRSPPLRFDTPMIMRSPIRGLGVAAGGAIVQKIYPDPYGFDTWQRKESARAQIHLVNSVQFSAITGAAPPRSPLSAADYTKLGLPWFELWDEELGDLGSQRALEGVRSLGAVDAAMHPERKEPSLRIRKRQIKMIRRTKPRAPNR